MGSCAAIIPSEVVNFDPNVISLEHFEIQRILGKGGFGKVNAVTKRSDPMKGEWFALKTMKKCLLVKSKKWEKLKQNIFAERNILSMTKHPFICNSYYAFQDEFNLYLVMDLAIGGDLRFQLSQTTNGFTEEQSKFYIAQLVLALERLNTLFIIHQDIKPENLLMDGLGYIKLSDFGLARIIPEKVSYEGAGTRGYIPPEIFQCKGHKHSFQADYFAVGVTLYEFLYRNKPYNYHTIQKLKFESPSKSEYVKSHVSTRRFPCKDNISDECKLFIQSLLMANPEFRLGANSISEIKNHLFFTNFDWDSLYTLKYRTIPYVPDPTRAHCDGVFDVRECLGNDEENVKLPANKQELFNGYEYNVNQQTTTDELNKRRFSILGSPELMVVGDDILFRRTKTIVPSIPNPTSFESPKLGDNGDDETKERESCYFKENKLNAIPSKKSLLLKMYSDSCGDILADSEIRSNYHVQPHHKDPPCDGE